MKLMVILFIIFNLWLAIKLSHSPVQNQDKPAKFEYTTSSPLDVHHSALVGTDTH
jgi:hypothetical protein